MNSSLTIQSFLILVFASHTTTVLSFRLSYTLSMQSLTFDGTSNVQYEWIAANSCCGAEVYLPATDEATILI